MLVREQPMLTLKVPLHKSTSTRVMSTSMVDPTNIFDQWQYAVTVGGVALIIAFILTIILCRCYKRKKFGIRHRTVEIQVRCMAALGSTMIRQNTILDQNKTESVSPIYCEAADTFHCQTGEPVRNFENISDEEYCYPKNTDQFENESLPEGNEEYSCVYDYMNVNTDYMNTFPRERESNRTHDDYEYPQNSRNSSTCEYRYAYDWWVPKFKNGALRPSKSEPTLQHTSVERDNMGDNFHQNHHHNPQTLSQENVEEENKIEPLEYVKVL